MRWTAICRQQLQIIAALLFAAASLIGQVTYPTVGYTDHSQAPRTTPPGPSLHYPPWTLSRQSITSTFDCRVFYPARQNQPSLPGQYTPDLPYNTQDFPNALPVLWLHGLCYPCVVNTPGEFFLGQIEELALRGYVVFSLDDAEKCYQDMFIDGLLILTQRSAIISQSKYANVPAPWTSALSTVAPSTVLVHSKGGGHALRLSTDPYLKYFHSVRSRLRSDARLRLQALL